MKIIMIILITTEIIIIIIIIKIFMIATINIKVRIIFTAEGGDKGVAVDEVVVADNVFKLLVKKCFLQKSNKDKVAVIYIY